MSSPSPPPILHTHIGVSAPIKGAQGMTRMLTYSLHMHAHTCIHRTHTCIHAKDLSISFTMSGESEFLEPSELLIFGFGVIRLETVTAFWATNK